MAIQYYMRAYNTTLSQYVDWIVNDQPDSTGIYSPYPTGQLTNITINKVVGSKIDNFLQPDEGFTVSDGYFFHLNSFDWLHASIPTATIIPPPTSFVGVAVTRGGITNGTGQLLPGASTNFFATMLWDETEQRWKFIQNTNGDHTTLGAYLPLGTGSLVVDGYIAVGTGPTVVNMPTTGSLRLQNNQWITARKLGNTDGYLVRLDTLDRIQLGNAVESPFVYVPGSVRVDGYVRDGSTFPSLSGFIRNGNATTIVTYRDVTNANDLNIFATNASNNILIGNAVSTQSNILYNTSTNAVHQFQTNTTSLLEIGTAGGAGGPNNFIRFDLAVVAPTIYQTNQTASATAGQTITLQGQNSTSVSGTVIGGPVQLRSGTGTTAHGFVDIVTGTDGITPGTNPPKIRVFPTVDATAANNTSILFGNKVLRFDSSLITYTPTTTIIGMRQDSIAVGATTTIAVASNNTSLPQTTINVTSTAGFSATTGTIVVVTNLGNQVVTYTGTTGTTFTGCSGGTGLMSTGGTVASSGQPLTIQSQNIITSPGAGGELRLTSGTGNTLTGTVQLQAGGVNKFTVSSTTNTHRNNIEQFDLAQTTPLIRQDTAPSGVGQTLTLQAQNITTGTGGNLILTSGAGTTSTSNLAGTTDIQTGSLSRILITPSLSVVTGSTVATATALLKINSFEVEGGNDATNIPSPIWKQKDRTGSITSTINGQTFTIQSQTSTIAGSIGGDLILGAGDGVLRDGYVRIQTGLADRVLITETQTVVFGDLLVLGIHTNINSSVVDIADRVIHVNSTAASYPTLSPAPITITGFSVDRGTLAGSTKRNYYGLFWSEGTIRVGASEDNTDGYWKFAINTDGYAPGSETTLTQTLPVIASTFLAQPLSLATIAAIPTAGGFRALNNTTALASRNLAGTQDLVLVRTDTANKLIWGAGSDGYNTGHIFKSTINNIFDFQVNDISQVQLGAGEIDIDGYAETIALGSTIVSPRIYQITQSGTGANSGTSLKINAQAGQNVAAGTNNNGGHLVLAAGTVGGGGTAGVDGYIYLQNGATQTLTINSIDIEADGMAEVIGIASAIVNPRIYQLDVSTASATGKILTISAQNATGTTSTGGALNLASGTGTTAAGVVNILIGSTQTVAFNSAEIDVDGYAEVIGLGATLAHPRLYQVTQTSPGVADGYMFKINAQSGRTQNGANANNNGGNLILSSGAAGTGGSGAAGLDGYLFLQAGSTTTASVVPNKFVFNKGRRRNIVNVIGATTVQDGYDYLAITTLSAPFTVTLPANPTNGDEYVVKDTTGNAAISNVTVSGNGNNIDGSPTFLMSQPYSGATFTFTNNAWSVI
jgi:hypothetical protein